MENQEEPEVPRRMAPVKTIESINGPKQPKKTHEWDQGVPAIEGILNIRRDTCRKCGCVREVVIRVGLSPWTAGYNIDGVTTTTAPLCNQKTQQ